MPAAWAPEIAAIASRAVTEKVNYRLLANTIAHQWWGVSVSPASRDDWWISDGFARYSEARYVEQAAGQAGLEEDVKDMSVGRAGLRHRAALQRRQARHLFAGIPVAGHRQRRDDPAHAALGDGRSEIRPDHARRSPRSMRESPHRWTISAPSPNRTTATSSPGSSPSGSIRPALPNSRPSTPSIAWATRQGHFAVRSGQISQDLDLFRMPVDLKIDTDGKTEEQAHRSRGHELAVQR